MCTYLVKCKVLPSYSFFNECKGLKNDYLEAVDRIRLRVYARGDDSYEPLVERVQNMLSSENTQVDKISVLYLITDESLELLIFKVKPMKCKKLFKNLIIMMIILTILHFR